MITNYMTVGRTHFSIASSLFNMGNNSGSQTIPDKIKKTNTQESNKLIN